MKHKLCPFCGSVEQGTYMRFYHLPEGMGGLLFVSAGHAVL
jgi:hypothetical protein